MIYEEQNVNHQEQKIKQQRGYSHQIIQSIYADGQFLRSGNCKQSVHFP